MTELTEVTGRTETGTGNFSRIADFVFANETAIPQTALATGAKLLVDTVGVAAGAAHMDAGRIAGDFAVDFMAAPKAENRATLLFDGRRTGIMGAAFALASRIDNLDAHDGFNPVKGHIGCAVVPALLAVAETLPHLSGSDLSGRDALAALVMSYEIAGRAGLSLHASVSDYHTSGAWNALGVAALGARLRGLNRQALRHALGIAEYHGPRSQMMREIDHPSMLHDGSGMGALSGIQAVLMAERGFTGAPAITVEAAAAEPHWRDLGREWTIEANYIKPYPICRWAHAAIDAARALKLEHKFDVSDIVSVEVRTFAEACRLFAGMPETTSQAQYSLPFAVACMLHFDRVGPKEISGAGLSGAGVAETIAKISVKPTQQHCDLFPAHRTSDVKIVLNNGRVLESGLVHARGGVEAPMDLKDLREKFNTMTAQTLPPNRAAAIWEAGFSLLDPGVMFKDFTALLFAPGT